MSYYKSLSKQRYGLVDVLQQVDPRPNNGMHETLGKILSGLKREYQLALNSNSNGLASKRKNFEDARSDENLYMTLQERKVNAVNLATKHGKADRLDGVAREALTQTVASDALICLCAHLGDEYLQKSRELKSNHPMVDVYKFLSDFLLLKERALLDEYSGQKLEQELGIVENPKVQIKRATIVEINGIHVILDPFIREQMLDPNIKWDGEIKRISRYETREDPEGI